MPRPISLIKMVALVCLFSLLAVGGAAAQEEEQAYVEYRQKLMASNGANMGAVGDIMKYQLPFSSSHVAAHARAIHESSQLINAAFKKQAMGESTDAEAAIWQDWSGFEKATKELETASAELVKVAESGDQRAIAQQVRSVGQACRGCHESFRKPREESYKRQQ